MNKKIFSLSFVLILLVTMTVSYAYITQPNSQDDNQTHFDGDVEEDTFASEINSTFLYENQDIEIGEMI